MVLKLKDGYIGMTDMRLSGSLGICLMKWLVRKGKPFCMRTIECAEAVS